MFKMSKEQDVTSMNVLNNAHIIFYIGITKKYKKAYVVPVRFVV